MAHDTTQEYSTKSDIVDLKIDMASMMEKMLEKHFEVFKIYVHEGIETVLKAQDERFAIIDKRLDGIDRRFDLVDKRFAETEARMIERFERVEEKIEKCVKKEDLYPLIKRVETSEDAVYP